MNDKRFLLKLNRSIEQKNFLGILQNLTSLQNVKNEKSLREIIRLKEIIRVLLHNNVKYNLYKDHRLEKIHIDLSYLLGSKFHNDLRDLVSRSYVNKYSLIFTEKISKLSSTVAVIEEFKSIFDRFLIDILIFPKEWNMANHFVFNSVLAIKQKITDSIFTDTLPKDDLKNLPDLIESLIDFEYTVLRKYFANICCANENCTHSKILSTIYIPYLGPYIKHLFSKVVISPNTVSVEMMIYSYIIEFFRLCGPILNRLRYFNDSRTDRLFGEEFNRILSGIVRKMNVEREFNKMLIFLNTLNFIERTTYDLHKNIRYSCEDTLELVRKLEKRQFVHLEKYINSDLKKRSIEGFIAKIISNDYKDIQNIILVKIVDFLLNKYLYNLSKIRMDRTVSEKFLIDMNNIEMILEIKKMNIVMMRKIQQYLKIYLVDPVETDAFVEGYFKYGNSFRFEDIVNRLVNRKNNMELYKRYKEKK